MINQSAIYLTFIYKFCFSQSYTFYLLDGSEAMCPTKLENEITLEATNNPANWGVCSKECNLKHYKSNQLVYDKVYLFCLAYKCKCHFKTEFIFQIVQLGEEYSSIAKPFIIGQSMKNQPMIGLRISKNVRQERKLLKPMVRLVANIGGNEVVGREILLQLGQHLLMGYGKVNKFSFHH